MRFSSQGVNHILLLGDIFLNIIVNFCLIASSQGVNHILLLGDIFLNIIVNFCLIAFNVVVDYFNSLHKWKHVSFESFNYFDGERVKNSAQMQLAKNS